jgi:nucleoside-diphosphate-sugar epimerase
MKKNILITGSSGFIGRHLVKSLKCNNDNDNDLILLSRRLDPESQFLQLVASLESITEQMIEYEIDTVVHLAGIAHRSSVESNSTDDFFKEINTNATLNLAKVLSRKGLKRFVFVSSIGVNGTSTNAPFTDSSAASPYTNYALSKYEAEEGLRVLSKKLGFELVIVRPPLVYGPYAPGNFGSLIKLISRVPLLPFGLTKNIRSFISVDNLASFLDVCVNHPKAADEIFLISDGEDVSTKEFTSAIAKGLGRSLYQLPVPVNLMNFVAKLLRKEKQAEQLFGNLQVNSNKARALLDWEPYETMSQAMKKLKSKE